MPVNIGLYDPNAWPPDSGRKSLVVSNGVSCYLSPHFERLAVPTGQMIDRWSVARFSGDLLPFLDSALGKILEELEQSDRPAQWEQKTAELFENGECFGQTTEPVSRQEVLFFVCSLRELVAEAIEIRGVILFSGDDAL